MHNTDYFFYFSLNKKKIEKGADETVSNGESLLNILVNHLQGELYSHFKLLELSHLKFHERNQSCTNPKRL